MIWKNKHRATSQEIGVLNIWPPTSPKPLWVSASSSLKQVYLFLVFFPWLGKHLPVVNNWKDIGCCYYARGKLGKLLGMAWFPVIKTTNKNSYLHPLLWKLLKEAIFALMIAPPKNTGLLSLFILLLRSSHAPLSQLGDSKAILS